MNKDITEFVNYDNPDDEYLPITECICGKRFAPWEFIISIYEETFNKCPECGAKLFFRNTIRVYQVVEDE